MDEPAAPRPVPGPRHIAISNVYTDRNRGGALLTVAAARMAQRVAPSSQVSLISNSAEYSPALYPFTTAACPEASLEGPPLRLDGSLVARSFTLLSVPPSLALGRGVPRRAQGLGYSALAEADVVVAKGGQLFRNFPGRQGRRSFWASSFPLRFAHRTKRPCIAYGVQIGPYWDDRSRKAASAVLRELDLVLARDDRSAEIAASLGAPVVKTMPDSAFTIDARTLTEPPPPGTPEGRFVVITPHFRFADDEAASLRHSIATSTRALLDSGQIDHVVVTHQSGGPALPDERVAGEIAASLDPARTVFLDGAWSPGQLLGLYGQATAVVAGRVHAGILAMLAGTPVLMADLPGTDKAAVLYGSLGLQSQVVRSSSAAYRELADRLIAVVEDATEGRRAIGAHVARLHAAAIAADQDVIMAIEARR